MKWSIKVYLTLLEAIIVVIVVVDVVVVALLDVTDYILFSCGEYMLI